MAITRLTTVGSAGYNTIKNSTSFEDMKRIPMFKIKNLYPIFLRQKEKLSGIILPAFDDQLVPQDAAYKHSYVPYRAASSVDPATGYPAFTGWVLHTTGYSYYGTALSSFISPAAVGYIDPIAELKDYVKNAGQPQWEYLIKKPSNREEKFVLPPAQRLALLNVWCAPINPREKDQSARNRVLVLKPAAYEKLAADLNELRPAMLQEPRDPNFPDFKYGDITDPNNAIEFTSGTYTLQNSALTSPCLEFGTLQYAAGGKSTLSCKNVRITEQMLAGRFDLADCENFLHVPTTQEVVDLLVHEGLVPYELLQRVCAPLVNNFPSQPVVQVRTSAQVAPAAENPLNAKLSHAAFMHAQEEEDNIPGLEPAVAPQAVTPAPVQSPVQSPVQTHAAQAAQSASSGVLTPEEKEEYEELKKLLLADSISIPADKLQRLQDLNNKIQQH